MPEHTVFSWLDEVRERPAMYAHNATELHLLVRGYYLALHYHGIREDVPEMGSKFSTWAYVDTDWDGFNCGWGYAFDHNTPEDGDAIATFFSFVDRYRLLQPQVTATITLKPDHQPNGMHRIVGLNGRMERPDAISVVNYAPTKLNHLRHHYSDGRVVDDSFLMLGNGSYRTQQSDLLDWVADEFGISHADWEIVPETTA